MCLYHCIGIDFLDLLKHVWLVAPYGYNVQINGHKTECVEHCWFFTNLRSSACSFVSYCYRLVYQYRAKQLSGHTLQRDLSQIEIISRITGQGVLSLGVFDVVFPGSPCIIVTLTLSQS